MSNGTTMKAEAPITTETVSLSDGPTMKAESPIPTEAVSLSNGPTETVSSSPNMTVSNVPNMNRTVAPVRRKAAKRTLPWDQAAGELLMSQDEDNPARKKLRLEEEPLPTTTDAAARKTATPDVSRGLPPPAVNNDDEDANIDAVTDTQPNAGSINRASARWTFEEDAKLTSAVAKTLKKKYGKEYKSDCENLKEEVRQGVQV
jgi:hypothetical protein